MLAYARIDKIWCSMIENSNVMITLGASPAQRLVYARTQDPRATWFSRCSASRRHSFEFLVAVTK